MLDSLTSWSRWLAVASRRLATVPRFSSALMVVGCHSGGSPASQLGREASPRGPCPRHLLQLCQKGSGFNHAWWFARVLGFEDCRWKLELSRPVFIGILVRRCSQHELLTLLLWSRLQFAKFGDKIERGEFPSWRTRTRVRFCLKSDTELSVGG
jgi:hypothetical protein